MGNQIKTKTLGEIINLRRGHDLPIADMQEGNIPVIGSNGIIGYHNKYTTKAPCLTVGRSGSVGKLFYSEVDSWAHNTALYVDDFKGNDPKYVYYLLRTVNLGALHSGSVVPSLNRNYLHPLKIKCATEITYQQKIAAILSVLDAKIELNQRINAELVSMAKTLYEYWFVQFDFPNENDKPYKSAGGKMIWNEKLKREIPLGWEVCELRQYITSNRGLSYSGKDITGGGAPMMNLNSFNVDATYKPEGIKTFSGSYSENKVLRPFDLVMCNTQQTALDPQKDIIGKSLLVPDIFESDIVSSHHVTTIVVSKEILKYYLNSLFNTEYFHRYISGYATGTNILGLNFEGVLSYRTAIPSDDLLKKYKSIVVNVEKQRNRIIKENQTLAELRDWLLPMLMNGQVKIS